MPTGRLYKLLPVITAWFDERVPTVYSDEDLSQLLEAERVAWQIPQYVNSWRFVNFLLDNTPLKLLHVQSIGERSERNILRYIWNVADPFLLGLSLRKRSYLTHSSAMLLHGLADQIPQTLFVTTQQRHIKLQGQLTQVGIDRAFTGKQRESNLAYRALDYRYVILESTYVDADEIVQIRTLKSGPSLRCSSRERTLIDICVRPSYSGGIFQVLEAYRRAKGAVDTKKLLSILGRHSFAYPYQQAIGFLLEKAGYSAEDSEPFLNAVSKFDFYLSYGLVEKSYVSKWRLYVPKGLE